MKTRPPTMNRAFTLVELLAAMVVLALLMVMIFAIFNQASKAWLLAENRTETFQSARLALDLMSRDLESAIATQHVNNTAIGGGSVPGIAAMPLITFEDSGSATIAGVTRGFAPPYGQSTAPNDAIFFVTQAPDSRNNGTFIDLAECGYYVAFANSSGLAGMTTGNYYLFRHYVRSNAAGGGWDVFSNPTAWWTTPAPGPGVMVLDTPLVENAIRFEMFYEYVNGAATAEVQNWNTYVSGPPNPPISDPTMQLPHAIHIQLSVLDRRAAARLAALWGSSGLSQSDLANLPFHPELVATYAAAPRILQEGLRTFFRSVYPRGAY